MQVQLGFLEFNAKVDTGLTGATDAEDGQADYGAPAPPLPPREVALPNLADTNNLAKLSFSELSKEDVHKAIWQSGVSRYGPGQTHVDVYS